MEYKKPPVQVGNRIQIHIDNIGTKGDGITIWKKFIIITPNTIKGRTYNVTITKVLNTYAFAKRIE